LYLLGKVLVPAEKKVTSWLHCHFRTPSLCSSSPWNSCPRCIIGSSQGAKSGQEGRWFTTFQPIVATYHLSNLPCLWMDIDMR
jgi:hypothetical protein